MGQWNTSRRGFIRQGALGLGFALFSAATPQTLRAAYERASEAAAEGAVFRFFKPDEAVDVIAFAAQVIPADETPGATEAQVAYFIDNALIEFAPEDQPKFHAALVTLNDLASKQAGSGGKRFAQLSSPEQIQAMKNFEAKWTSVGLSWDPSSNGMNHTGDNQFELMRTYVVTGFLCDPDLSGNRDMIGWKLIGFDGDAAHFPPFGYYDAELLKEQSGKDKK